MVQVIYGDVLLLIDFCMNFFVLHTTAVILRRRIKVFCLAGAAFIGGIYSVAKIFINGNDLLDCVISLSVGILMCYVSFGGYKFFKSAVVFFSAASLLGGIMFSVYFLLGSYHTDLFGNIHEYTYSHIPIWLFMVLAAVSLVISWMFFYIGRERTDISEETVIVEYMGRSAPAKLMLDSGNLAREPISGKYVIMLSRAKARVIIGEAAYSAVLRKDSEYLLAKRFRLVCVSGIGGDKRTYYAFLPDRIYMEKGKHDLDIDAYVAVCDTDVAFGDCEGLAHPSIVV